MVDIFRNYRNDDVPKIFQGLTPTIKNGGLSPLQLALAAKLAAGFRNPWYESPLLVNRGFLAAMTQFTDSKFISPITYGARTVNAPDVQPGITSINYVVDEQENVYMIRRAPDCGPEENRLERVLIGKLHELAEGTFAYYGSVIRGGSTVNGAGGPYGTGGITSPYPGPDDAIDNPNRSDLVDYGTFAVGELTSYLGSPIDINTIGRYAGRGGIA